MSCFLTPKEEFLDLRLDVSPIGRYECGADRSGSAKSRASILNLEKLKTEINQAAVAG